MPASRKTVKTKTALGMLVLIANLVIGGVVIAAALDYQDQEEQLRSEAQEQYDLETQRRDTIKNRVDVARARLEGLRSDDPYVIELIARKELGFTEHPNEVQPPRQR